MLTLAASDAPVLEHEGQQRAKANQLVGGVRMIDGETIRVFAQKQLDDHLELIWHRLEAEVTGEQRDRLLTVGEGQYVDYLVAKYSLDSLVVHWDDMTADHREENFPAERFPKDMMVRSAGGSYPRQVFSFFLPYEGDATLFQMCPTHYPMWSESMRITPSAAVFDVVNWRDDIGRVESKKEEILRKMRQKADAVSAKVNAFNSALPGEVESVVRTRKDSLLKQANMFAQLGVPIRQAANVSPTFSVPVSKARPLVPKPEESPGPYVPEPSLDAEVYQAILNICFDAGKAIERLPSVYKDKDEEALRDHLLIILSPHFESATGETFNKAGKTDILVRHSGGNVFVAECKFWHGGKAFHAALDQTLGYLTWRDSKAAVVVFVRNRSIASVLSKIEEITPQHPAWLKTLPATQEGWSNYIFHLPGDPGRELKLAILCFHFPEVD